MLEKGDIFGESGLFPPAKYAVTAEPINDARVMLFPVEKLRSVAQQIPEVSWKISAILDLRLRRAYRQIRNQALMDTYSRLLSRLYKLIRDYGEDTEAGYRLKLSLTHQELANFIGASRETVSRLMKDMEREGLIEVKENHLLIPDLNTLRKELSII